MGVPGEYITLRREDVRPLAAHIAVRFAGDHWMTVVTSIEQAILGAAIDTCEWFACDGVALCRSGNWGDRLVCEEHFTITNGSGAEVPIGAACDEWSLTFNSFSSGQAWGRANLNATMGQIADACFARANAICPRIHKDREGED